MRKIKLTLLLVFFSQLIDWSLATSEGSYYTAHGHEYYEEEEKLERRELKKYSSYKKTTYTKKKKKYKGIDFTSDSDEICEGYYDEEAGVYVEDECRPATKAEILIACIIVGIIIIVVIVYYAVKYCKNIRFRSTRTSSN